HIPPTDSLWYAAIKRGIDLVGGVLMGIVVVIAAPCIWIANRIEGPGPLFIVQERFGLQGSRMRAYKFRSMTKNLSASGEWTNEGENRVTKVGTFLRMT